MDIVKNQWLEQEERGWSDPRTAQRLVLAAWDTLNKNSGACVGLSQGGEPLRLHKP